MANAGPLNTAISVPASTTHAARLADRDVLPSSLCGFWINSDGQNLVTEFTTEIVSWWCPAGPCAIDTFVTPNVVFCPSQAPICTSYYAYGSWPVGGCSTGETCCPSSNPKVLQRRFDNGASIGYGCMPTDWPDTMAVTTQIGSESVELLKYTPPNTASTTTLTSTSTSIRVTSNVNESGTSATSATSSLTTTSAPSPTTSQHTSLLTSPSSGLSIGAKAGIGVAVPLAFITFILGLFWFLRRRKNSRAPEPQPETHNGGLPEPISTVSELKANPDSFPGAAYGSPRAEAGGVPIHEIAASQERPIGHELTVDPPQYQARSPPSPISPTPPTRKPVPSAEAGPASFPPPWDSSSTAEYEGNLRTGPILEAEDAELAQLKVEVARVKQRRERLQELEALEAREEELRERILARGKIAVRNLN
ncbi:hypothetical protein V8E51_005114 [Hyaloscypha variabilis]